MISLLATMTNELLMLKRDKAGLAVLFLMPVFLVIIVSLVHNNVLENSGEGISMIYIDNDGDEVGEQIEELFTEYGAKYKLVKKINNKSLTLESALNAVNDGKYQIGLIIPKGFTTMLKEKVAEIAIQALHDKQNYSKNDDLDTNLTIFFDPVTQGIMRTAVISNLKNILIKIESDYKIDAIEQYFPDNIKSIIKESLLQEVGNMMPKKQQKELISKLPKVNVKISNERILGINCKVLPAPTAVQQNVPAWTLFGMFFIVIPLGSTLLQERDNGTFKRLQTMPVPIINILIGKVVAYLIICLLQFIVMIMIGIFVLPLFGTSALELGNALGALILVAFSSALAATGFGILIATVAKSYRQASVFGPVSIVIASSIGGIMIPVYIMPETMKNISVYSPMAWGLNGFLDIFVRNGDIYSAMPWIIRLIIFSFCCLLVAYLSFRKCWS